ncbi:MAG: PAS domain S-box protein [Gammaproteobacteria bacterium]|nr:PAS domain S-box protein [Gammaproteobacteria bacterium]
MTAPNTASAARASGYGLDQIWTLQGSGGHLSEKGMLLAALLAVPTVASSLSRSLEHGWHDVYLIHLALGAAVVAAAALGARLAPRRRAALLLGLLVAAGAGEMLAFGLAGTGLLLLATSGVVVALAYGTRAALLVLGFALLIIVVAAMRALADPTAAAAAAAGYAGSVTAWIPAGVLFIIFVLLMIAGIGGSQAATLASTAALRESEEGYRNLIEGSIQGIAIHRDWKPLFANRAIAGIFGFATPEELLESDSLEDLIAPYERDRLNAYLAARKRGDYAPSHYEFDAIRADGTVMTLQSIASMTTWRGEPAVQFAVIDVTERDRAVRALRESEATLAAFFDNSPHPLTIKDPDGRYVKVNPAAARITGLDKEEVAGKRASDFYPEESAAHITRADREVMETRGAVTYEHRMQTALGDRVFLAVGFPIMGADGEITGIGRIATDVTEQQRAEIAHRASEARMAAFFEHSPHSITIKDLEGRYVQVNPAAADIAGTTPEKLVGRRATDFYSAEHAGIIEAFDQRVKDTLDPIEYEQTLHAESGDRYLWGVGFPILGADGELVALGRITTDVSERKRAEQALRVSEARFKAFFGNSPHAMIIQNREGRYIEENSSAVELFGIEVRNYMGKLIEEVWPEDIAARTRELNEQVLASGTAIEYETDFAGPSRSAWVQVVKFPIADPENELIGVGTIFSDITRRKLAEDALVESRQRFRDFAEASSDWFWEAGPDLSFTYVSDRCSRLLNLDDLSALELARLGENASRDIALQPDAARRFRHALAQRRSFREFEFPIEDGWGRTRYIRIGAKAVLDRDGEFGGYRGVGSDVTDALENQRQANALRDAIKESSDGVLLFDKDDHVLFTSDEFHRMHPHAPPKDRIVGMSRAEVIRSIVEAGWVDHPLARSDPERYLAQMLKRNLRDESRVDEQTYANGHTYLRRYRRTGDGDALVLLTDITARKESERRLEAYQAELRRLTSEVSLAEERERRRIAAELHDGAVQNLGLARIKLGSLRSRVLDVRDSDDVEEVRALLDRSIREVRSLVAELSPPMLYELGLEPAVEWLAERFRTRHGLDCEVEVEESSIPLSSEVEIFLFQAIRELLVNVVKHAGARHVSIAVRRDEDAIEVVVHDDGVGISPAELDARPTDASGFGLFSVRERAGLLGGEMRIEADRGTRVTIRAPLHAARRTA